MTVIQPKQKISKKLFEECLMIKHNEDIRISKRKLPNGDNMYMYFVSHDQHRATWTKGNGWEFPSG
jgi:hypothetical protein